MPELPEVETVARSLRPRVVGKTIQALWTSGKPLRLAKALDVASLKRVCVQAEIQQIRRLGKYLIFALDQGSLLVHLGMSGQLRLQDNHAARPAHTHVAFQLSTGQELRFVDPRRFGWIEAGVQGAEFAPVAALGPDPLAQLKVPALRGILAGSKAAIKAVLLDQRKVAGLGNIYVCEALHTAGIHPATSAERTVEETKVLFQAIQAALRMGLKNRGTSLRDYVDADGRSGTNASALKVYGREGLPCLTCETRILRRMDGGRSSFFCPRCQPE